MLRTDNNKQVEITINLYIEQKLKSYNASSLVKTMRHKIATKMI